MKQVVSSSSLVSIRRTNAAYSTSGLLDHQGTKMSFFDLPLSELQAYCPERDEPADFESFWNSTLEEARTFPLDATFEKNDFSACSQSKQPGNDL